MSASCSPFLEIVAVATIITKIKRFVNERRRANLFEFRRKNLLGGLSRGELLKVPLHDFSYDRGFGGILLVSAYSNFFIGAAIAVRSDFFVEDGNRGAFDISLRFFLRAFEYGGGQDVDDV